MCMPAHTPSYQNMVYDVFLQQRAEYHLVTHVAYCLLKPLNYFLSHQEMVQPIAHVNDYYQTNQKCVYILLTARDDRQQSMHYIFSELSQKVGLSCLSKY